MRSWENVNELNATYFVAIRLLTNKTLPPIISLKKKNFSSNESYAIFTRGGDIR